MLILRVRTLRLRARRRRLDHREVRAAHGVGESCLPDAVRGGSKEHAQQPIDRTFAHGPSITAAALPAGRSHLDLTFTRREGFHSVVEVVEMTHDGMPDVTKRLRKALHAEPASARLQTAMAAGLRSDERYIDVLVERCAVEPDFFVRDMLTWALIQHDHDRVLERVLPELVSVFPQARSQALHTVSKLGDQWAWPAISDALLTDSDDQVAQTAWRAAATLVPAPEAPALADVLATQFGRGDLTTQRSLSRALASLGEDAAPVIERSKRHPNPRVRAHALATEHLAKDPDADFDAAVAHARRTAALHGAPLVDHLDQ